MERTPGADAGKGPKYEFSVIAYLASILSLNEEVVNYRIFSNAQKYEPFGDVVARVRFRGSDQDHIYVVQIKSGNDKFPIDKYFSSYTKIMATEDEERIQFWYFAVKDVEYFSRHFRKQRLFCNRERGSANPKDILYHIPSCKLSSNDSKLSRYKNFFSNFHLYLGQPDSEAIQKIIEEKWKIDAAPHSYIEKYFGNISIEGLDKAAFEHELLKIRLENYILTPTKAIEIRHQAVAEWNRLTLRFDVTIVRNELNIEQYLFGCILQLISDVISIEKWNLLVDSDGRLDSDVKDQFNELPCKPKTLKDLMVRMWEENKMPLILKTGASLSVLKELSHLEKKYIIIDTNIGSRSTEIDSYGLKVFSNLGDIATATIMENILVSLQGRQPTSLDAIIGEGEDLKKNVTCLDIINLMKPRELYLKKECLKNSKYMLFIVETSNPQQQHQLTGSNITIYCAPGEGESNYKEKIVNSEFKNYKILRISATDDGKFKLTPRTPGQYEEEYRGLECFFVDQNEDCVYNMADGTIVPVIGEVPIRTDAPFHWKYVSRYLREGIDEGREYSEQMLAENDFFKECSGKINVITGEPGMGKTTLLHSLFDFCESKYYVLFIDLAQVRDKLRSGELTSFEDLLDLSRDKCSSLTYNCFLNSLHHYTNRLVLILDSFDEVLVTCKDQVLKLVTSIQEVRLQNVIIGSRLTALNFLSGNCETKIFKIEGLQLSDILYTNDWNLDIETLRHAPSEFLTTPLYLNMLRTLSEDRMNLEIVNQWDLYEGVLKLKMADYSRRNCLAEDVKQYILEKHGELALKVIFDNNEITKKLEQSVQPSNSQFIQLGFITHIDNENPVFIHRTFAEFFVIKWLIWKVDSDFAADIYELLLDENRKWGICLLDMYTESFPLHKAVLKGDIDEVRRVCRENPRCLMETDELGRHALHIAATTNSIYHTDTASVFVPRMRSAGCDIHARDKILEWRWLDYLESDFIEYTPLAIKEFYLNFYATHIEELEDCKYSISKNFNDLYDTAVCFSLIGLVRDLLVLKYHENHAFLEFREMCLGAREIGVSQIELPEERLKGVHLACIYSNIKVVQAYIAHGADFTETDRFNCTPLHYCVIAKENYEILTLILNTYEIPNKYAGLYKETTVLNMSIRTGDFNVMKMVLERLDIQIIKEWNSVRQKHPALDLAIRCENNDMVEVLLRRLNPDRLKRNFTSHLNLAVYNKNKDAIETLVDYGADIDAVGRIAGPLGLATEMISEPDELEYVLQNPANRQYYEDPGEGTPLAYAIRRNYSQNEDIVKILLDRGADVNLMGKDGETPLCLAIELEKLEVVKLLLEKGVRLDYLNSMGWTPLICAIRKGRKDIIRMLVNGIHFRGKRGITPLCEAIKKGSADIIQILLDHQADVNSVDEYGLSPLIFAAETKGEQIAQMLLTNKETDVNFKNEFGITALYAARMKKNEPMIKLLLKHGADVNVAIATSAEEIFRKARSAKKIEIIFWLLKGCIVTQHWPRINLLYELRATVNQQSINLEILIEYGGKINIEDEFWKVVFYLVNEMNNEEVDNSFFRNLGFSRIYRLMRKVCGVTIDGKLDIINVLLRYRREVAVFLRTAIKCGNKNIIEIILRNVDVRNLVDRWELPLYIAVVVKQDTEIVKMLLKHGFPVNYENSEYFIPLLFEAVTVGNIEIVKILLEGSANINYKVDGVTALHVAAALHAAAATKDRSMVRTLLQYGASKHVEIIADSLECYLNRALIQLRAYNASEMIDKVKLVIEEVSIEMQNPLL